MTPKKYEVRINFFSGFYESIHDEVFDSEIGYITEEYDKEYDDFRFTIRYNSYVENYIKTISDELGMDLVVNELVSPREYNFSTDVITVWMKPRDLKKISSALNSETLKYIIKKRFTSRSGFISFYSNNVEEWKEKPVKEWDCVELGTLLDAWIVDNFSWEYWKELDYIGYEYCQGNGQYVEYEKLWDEEAEMEKRKCHERDVEMLEKWKNNVAQW